MVSDAVETRRSCSAALFNNRYFADVAAAILEQTQRQETLVTTRQVASVTGLADSIVRAVVLRLLDAALLSKLARVGGGRTPQYYQVESTEDLRAIVALVDEKA